MAITNTHETDIISQVRLPDGKTYEIHDPNAIHDVSDLDLAQALVFKGTTEGYDFLPKTGNKIGDVYISIGGDGNEYVWDGGGWVALGNVHDAASSTHTHTATVTGTNSLSDVVGSVNVTSVTVQKRYIDASASAPTLTKASVLAATADFSVSGGTATTTKLKATASGTAVGAKGTAKAITGLGTPTTETAITGLTTDTAVYASVLNGVLTLTPVTVATGAKSTASAITSLGTPTTTDVLTGVEVTSQPSVTLASGTSGDVTVATGVSAISVSAMGDTVEAVTGVTPGKISLALHDAETQGSQRIVSNVETDHTSVSFNKGSYAKPQTWKQDSGTTGTPNN
jgi:hypothetical protein